jgi:hypothetical protein
MTVPGGNLGNFVRDVRDRGIGTALGEGLGTALDEAIARTPSAAARVNELLNQAVNMPIRGGHAAGMAAQREVVNFIRSLMGHRTIRRVEQ